MGVYEVGGCGNGVEAGATLLATGTAPAYYHRQVTDTYQVSGLQACGCRPDQDLVRQHHISALLYELADHPSLLANVSRSLVWKNPETYLSEMEWLINQQERYFAGLAHRLAELGLLSEAEAATVRPRLQIRISDVREARDTPLPALSLLPDNVTVESQ